MQRTFAFDVLACPRCGGRLRLVALILESVLCDDGCRASIDIVGATLGTDDRVVQLRASRGGSGTGRTYTIRYSATDASGNVSNAQTAVVIPHDSRAR